MRAGREHLHDRTERHSQISCQFKLLQDFDHDDACGHIFTHFGSNELLEYKGSHNEK